jgi:hypothetical protein
MPYKDPDNRRLVQRRRLRRARYRVLSHYSGGMPSCACCGEMTYHFLSLDHVDGGGNKERIKLQLGGSHFYTRLEREGFPPGYRVLCHNCNMSYGFYGYCPHTDPTKGSGWLDEVVSDTRRTP